MDNHPPSLLPPAIHHSNPQTNHHHHLLQPPPPHLHPSLIPPPLHPHSSSGTPPVIAIASSSPLPPAYLGTLLPLHLQSPTAIPRGLWNPFAAPPAMMTTAPSSNSPVSEPFYRRYRYMHDGIQPGSDVLQPVEYNQVGTTQHRNALLLKENLLNQAAHIENVILKQNEELIIMKNRLRSKTTIDVIRWLTFQACALRGHDESSTSKNRGNFLEILELLASYNDEVANVILRNAPYNSEYTSSDIQREILSIIANKVRTNIRSEVGDSYFCVMVDESRDESKKEQIAIVLRFVDEKRLIREKFLDLVHVKDTLSASLRSSLWQQLLHYQFHVSKICGQGYDGASNMRGEWNGLQALVLKNCPYSYYVHCFAHRDPGFPLIMALLQILVAFGIVVWSRGFWKERNDQHYYTGRRKQSDIIVSDTDTYYRRLRTSIIAVAGYQRNKEANFNIEYKKIVRNRNKSVPVRLNYRGLKHFLEHVIRQSSHQLVEVYLVEN
ncbi:hypothetical protein SSX86_029765 [Deinandra increscens subsp. villosa]|uniref:DUF4371 domain-containing protein n=1 Tax=Deinandra increscens subsp. villosa TaxID=3103831 RepID=A0AAP0CFN8_9ASTR